MNNKKMLSDELLTRWLSGEADEREREAVAAWAGESPEREQIGRASCRERV